jgi:glycosyltransferase involved in cell wall biosynthesis
MRVLHVINSLGPGGAEMNLLRLVEYADRARVETHVAYCGHWPRDAEMQRIGAPVLRLSERFQRIRSVATPAIIGRLARYIRRNRIDLVHTHLFNAHVWGGIAGRLAGAKVLEHVHDPRYSDRALLARLGLPGMGQFDQAPLFTRLSHHTVVLTRQNEDYLVKRIGRPPSRVSIIPNGLAARGPLPAPEERARLRESLGIPPDAFVTIALGRLVPQKNFPLLIAAGAQLAPRIPNLLMVILGDGPDRPALQMRIDAARLGNHIRLAGHHTDVQSWYDAADVFLQCSLFELQSLALMEAMQAGLPPIVALGLGFSDDAIAHGETGLLLPPNDPERWAESIYDLFAEPALRVEMGLRGKAYIEQHCEIRSVTRRFETLYEEICGS